MKYHGFIFNDMKSAGAVPTKSAVSVRTKTPKTKKVLKKTPVTVAKKAAPKNIDKKLILLSYFL